MSYFLIKGPGDFGQYLCSLDGYREPQWWNLRKSARIFPDRDSAERWLAWVKEQFRDAGSYDGRVVRVNTVRDWKAERGQLRAEIRRLRRIIPTCKRGPKACDTEIERLRAGLVAIRDDPHQVYGMGEYCMGVADGHRCAAGKARVALGEKEQEST